MVKNFLQLNETIVPQIEGGSARKEEMEVNYCKFVILHMM